MGVFSQHGTALEWRGGHETVRVEVWGYDSLRAEGEDEVVSLCRSAWAGSQRYGAAVWSGDVDSTFEDLLVGAAGLGGGR